MSNHNVNELIDGLVPIKLCSARAWRTYLGGMLLDELYGVNDPADSHFPEEWIMSIVSARIQVVSILRMRV